MSALSTIHVGLKRLGIVEDDARDLYERQTGKRSLRAMSPKDHDAIITELRRLGFKRQSSGPRRRLEGRFAPKLQALWIAAWNLGIVDNRDDAALIAFVRRQTGIDHVRFLRHPEDAAKAIEALKGWMAREAGVDWHVDKMTPSWARLPGAQIALAQWRLLAEAGAESGLDAFRCFVEARSINRLSEMTARDWRHVMNTLGERIRKARR